MNYLNFDAKIEPIGTMERYVVSPYSAEGGNYYNVDEASTVVLNNLKIIHADAVLLVSASRTNLSATIVRRDIAKNKANECQAKRDAKSGGIAKNNACDIRYNQEHTFINIVYSMHIHVMYIYVQCIFHVCTCLYSVCTLPLDSFHERYVLEYDFHQVRIRRALVAQQT